jgi:hypothetical protein
VGVGDVLPDMDFISGVDPYPITLDVDQSFIELEFMPEYEAAFGDERTEAGSEAC